MQSELPHTPRGGSGREDGSCVRGPETMIQWFQDTQEGVEAGCEPHLWIQSQLCSREFGPGFVQLPT